MKRVVDIPCPTDTSVFVPVRQANIASQRETGFRAGLTSLEGIEAIRGAVNQCVPIERIYFTGGRASLLDLPATELQEAGTRLIEVTREQLITCCSTRV